MSSQTPIASKDEVLQALTRILRRQEQECVVVTTKSRKSYIDDSGNEVIEENESAEVYPIPTKISDIIGAAELLYNYFDRTDEVIAEMRSLFNHDIPDRDIRDFEE